MPSEDRYYFIHFLGGLVTGAALFGSLFYFSRESKEQQDPTVDTEQGIQPKDNPPNEYKAFL